MHSIFYDFAGFYILLMEMGSDRDDGQGTVSLKKGTKYRINKG